MKVNGDQGGICFARELKPIKLFMLQFHFGDFCAYKPTFPARSKENCSEGTEINFVLMARNYLGSF